MELEKEIKQPKFRNEFHKLAVNIIYTYGWLSNLQSGIFKEYNITPSQFNILRILRGQYPQPATIILLKERMLDKMSDASRLVERLKNKGLIKREICPEDRRQVDVVITDKGLSLLAEIDKLNERQDTFFEKISSSEAHNLNALLDKLRG